MVLKRENNYSNAICVPKLVENEVLRQILGPLCWKSKMAAGGHFGFANKKICTFSESDIVVFLGPRNILSENQKLFSEKKMHTGL